MASLGPWSVFVQNLNLLCLLISPSSVSRKNVTALVENEGKKNKVSVLFCMWKVINKVKLKLAFITKETVWEKNLLAKN